jgi:hypothetical protein
MVFDPSSIDLQRLSESLQRTLKSHVVPGSILEGKTVLREATLSLLHCSELEAENVVDTLVARGFAQFREHPDLPNGAAWFLGAGS